MRYNDWDVCLYSREDCMPLREFKTECLTVPYLDENDSQQSSSHDDGFFPHRKMPTVTTHVPSLAPGAPFCVNINRWMPAFRSKPTDASDRIVIRVLIDGTLAAQSMRAEDASWPYDVDHALGPNKPGIAMPLRFPTFRKEFLRKNERLDLGCITVVITEWSPREQKTVVFSFRYAPIDILETSRIAWPNPAMWCDDVAAIGPPSPPSHEPKDCEQQSANSKHLGAATNLPSPTTISYSGCVFNWPGSVPQQSVLPESNVPQQAAMQPAVAVPPSSTVQPLLLVSSPADLQAWISQQNFGVHPDASCQPIVDTPCRDVEMKDVSLGFRKRRTLTKGMAALRISEPDGFAEKWKRSGR